MTIVRRAPVDATFRADAYGADMSGGSGGRTAVQAAVDAAVARIIATGVGQTVLLPEGVVSFDTAHPSPPAAYAGAKLGVALPVNLPATLRIKGAGRGLTTIKLSANSKNAFWINKQADYDVFQNVVFEDFDIDNNSSTGRCHILIGNWPEFETAQIRLSFQNITVRRMGCSNVPLDATLATTNKTFVLLQGKHSAANEATQTFSKNILCEDLEMFDSQYGVAVYCPVSGGATNHYHDRINFRRCRHVIATAPAASVSETSFYVCGAGFGDYFSIVDCESVNIGDDAIELGSMQTGLISGFRSTNPWLSHMVFRLTHPLANPSAQQIVIRDCTLSITPALYAATSGGGSGAPSLPVNFINDDSSNSNFGTFIFDNVHHVVDGAHMSRHPRGQGLAFNTFGFRVRAQMLRLIMKHCSVQYRNFVYDVTGIQDCDFFYISVIPVLVGDSSHKPGVAELLGCSVYMETTSGTSSDHGGMNLIGVNAGGDKGRVSVDGFTFQSVGQAPTDAISTANLALVGGHGTPQLVRLRRLTGHSYTTASGAYTRRGVLVRSTTAFDSTIVQDCDFTNWITGTATNNIETSTAGSNAAKVTALDNIDGP